LTENEIEDMKEQHNQQLTLLRSQHEAHIANAEHAQSLIIDNMKQEAQTGRYIVFFQIVEYVCSTSNISTSVSY